MAIFKAKVESHYAQIPNSTLQDNRLSFEARGLLAMLLSMPDDWEVTRQWICNQTSAGRDKVQRMINELVSVGYIRKSQQRINGRFSANDMFVFATPEDAIPVDGLPVDGIPATTKETDLQNKELTNDGCHDDNRARQSELVEKGFEWFWVNVWKRCKKSIGKTDTSPKSDSLSKHWKPLFNSTYWKNKTESDFKEEINRMAEFCWEAHSVDGFNRFENMQLPKFLKQKQWRD